MHPIAIATMGKYTGPVTKSIGSAGIGGVAPAPPVYKEKPIPDIILGKVKEDEEVISIQIEDIKENEDK